MQSFPILPRTVETPGNSVADHLISASFASHVTETERITAINAIPSGTPIAQRIVSLGTAAKATLNVHTAAIASALRDGLFTAMNEHPSDSGGLTGSASAASEEAKPMSESAACAC